MSALHDVKCKHCHKLLFKADGLGRVEIVCRSCSVFQKVDLARPLSRPERGARLDTK